MSLHPFDTRRYTELAAQVSHATKIFIRLAELLIDELEYRKKERTVRKVHYKAMSQEEARLQAISDGHDVIFMEEIRENRWQVTVSL